MATYTALIERSNHKDIRNVEVQVTLFDRRTPDTTVVHFTGTSLLA